MPKDSEGRVPEKSCPCCDVRACAGVVERRRRVIQSARSLFAERGHNATGMARIAEASGIGIGQIYRDFCSRECIVAKVFESYLLSPMIEDELDAAIDNDDHAAVDRWLIAIIDPCPTMSDRYAATELFSEVLRNPRVSRLYAAFQHRTRLMLLRALRFRFPKMSTLPECTLAAELIMTMSAGLIDRHLADPEWNGDAVVDLVRQQVEQLLTASSGRPSQATLSD